MSTKSELMVDLKGRIAFASTYFCDLVGIDYDKIEGKSCFDFVFPEDMPEAKKRFELLKSLNGEPFRFRLRIRDGEPIWVEVQSLALRDAHGTAYVISAMLAIADTLKMPESAVSVADANARWSRYE